MQQFRSQVNYGHAYSNRYDNFEKIAFVAVEESPYDVDLVGRGLRSERLAQEQEDDAAGLTAEIVALREQVAALSRAIAGGGLSPSPQPQPNPGPEPLPQPQPGPEPLPQPQPGPEPLPQPQPGPDPRPAPEDPNEPPDPGPGPEPLPDTDLSRANWQTLTQRCASCHNTSKANGEFALFEADKLTHRPMTAGKLILIDQVLYSNEMPKPPHPKFSGAEYNRFRAWMNVYTQDIREVARTVDGH